MSKAKTKTAYLCWTFSEYSKSGYSYTIADSMPDENSDYFNFIKEIQVPEVDMEQVLEKGCKYMDSQVAEHQVKINAILERKSQLLALTHID